MRSSCGFTTRRSLRRRAISSLADDANVIFRSAPGVIAQCHSRVLRHASVFRVTAHPHVGEGEDRITGLELRDVSADGRDDARDPRAPV